MLKFQQFPAMQQGSRVQQILGDQEQHLGNKLIGKGFLNLLSRVQDCWNKAMADEFCTRCDTTDFKNRPV